VERDREKQEYAMCLNECSNTPESKSKFQSWKKMLGMSWMRVGADKRGKKRYEKFHLNSPWNGIVKQIVFGILRKSVMLCMDKICVQSMIPDSHSE
jgi:hypothetical protein